MHPFFATLNFELNQQNIHMSLTFNLNKEFHLLLVKNSEFSEQSFSQSQSIKSIILMLRYHFGMFEMKNMRLISKLESYIFPHKIECHQTASKY